MERVSVVMEPACCYIYEYEHEYEWSGCRVIRLLKAYYCLYIVCDMGTLFGDSDNVARRDR